jgi:hypothetical protein
MQSEETRASLLQRNPKRTDRHLSRDYGRSPCSKGAACSSPFGAIGERLAAVCLGSRICLSVSSARNPHWCCYLGTTLDMCTDALSVRMAAFIAEDLPVASGTVRWSRAFHGGLGAAQQQAAFGSGEQGIGRWTSLARAGLGRLGSQFIDGPGGSRIDFTPPSPASRSLDPLFRPSFRGCHAIPPHKWLSAAQSERSTNSLLTVERLLSLPYHKLFSAPEAVSESPSIQASTSTSIRIPNPATSPAEFFQHRPA